MLAASTDLTPFANFLNLATKKPSILERYFVIEKLAELDEDDELRALLSMIMMVLLEKSRG